MDKRIEILRSKIRPIPNFPKPGVMFRDITTLWNDAEGFRLSTDLFVETFHSDTFDTVIGIESRGFILGAAFADRMGKAFVPIRKRGKLPADVERYEYQLEYGSDCVEIHKDALVGGHRVLVMDDLLATGGTMRAAVELLNRVGGKVVACAFMVELVSLGGRALIEADGNQVFSLVQY